MKSLPKLYMVGVLVLLILVINSKTYAVQPFNAFLYQRVLQLADIKHKRFIMVMERNQTPQEVNALEDLQRKITKEIIERALNEDDVRLVLQSFFNIVLEDTQYNSHMDYNVPDVTGFVLKEVVTEFREKKGYHAVVSVLTTSGLIGKLIDVTKDRLNQELNHLRLNASDSGQFEIEKEAVPESPSPTYKRMLGGFMYNSEQIRLLGLIELMAAFGGHSDVPKFLFDTLQQVVVMEPGEGQADYWNSILGITTSVLWNIKIPSVYQGLCELLASLLPSRPQFVVSAVGKYALGAISKGHVYPTSTVASLKLVETVLGYLDQQLVNEVHPEDQNSVLGEAEWPLLVGFVNKFCQTRTCKWLPGVVLDSLLNSMQRRGGVTSYEWFLLRRVFLPFVRMPKHWWKVSNADERAKIWSIIFNFADKAVSLAKIGADYDSSEARLKFNRVIEFIYAFESAPPAFQQQVDAFLLDIIANRSHFGEVLYSTAVSLLHRNSCRRLDQELDEY